MNTTLDTSAERNTVLCMPAFNEADGIEEFLSEIHRALPLLHAIVVVDDCSTDNTLEILNHLRGFIPNIKVFSMRENSGHGLSTVRALREASSMGVEYVMTCDGDGQIAGSDLKKLLSVMSDCEVNLVEGRRVQRTDPNFRKPISFITRIVVRIKSGHATRDANTPFRVYRNRDLKRFLNDLHHDSLVPNLWCSIWFRKEGLKFVEVEVVSLHRRGATQQGSTWQQRYAWLPSTRLVRFCWRSWTEMVTRKL